MNKICNHCKKPATYVVESYPGSSYERPTFLNVCNELHKHLVESGWLEVSKITEYKKTISDRAVNPILVHNDEIMIMLGYLEAKLGNHWAEEVGPTLSRQDVFDLYFETAIENR